MRLTKRGSENSDVLPSSSVTVAVMELPSGTAGTTTTNSRGAVVLSGRAKVSTSFFPSAVSGGFEKRLRVY